MANTTKKTNKKADTNVAGTNFKKSTVAKRSTSPKKKAPTKSAAAAPARIKTAKAPKAKSPKVVKAKALIVPEVLPPVITVENKPQAISRTPNALAVVGDNGIVQMGRSVIDLLKELPTMADNKLQRILQGSIEAERAMWVVKGASAHEVVKRATADGSQFSKMKGMGLDSLIGQVATELGVNTFTLRDDYKAFAEFGGYIKEQLTENPEALLPREYYVTAAKVSDDAKVTRFEALEYFEEQRQAMGGEAGYTYYTDHARRDLKLFNQGHTVEQVRRMDGTARNEKVKAKKASAGEKLMTVHLASTEANQNWIRQIIEKYGSVTKWFEKTAEAEFGKFKAGN